MFGLFKKKNESNHAKLKNEFDDIVRQVKSVERTKQGLVGRGIQEAEKSFLKKYSTASFQDAPFAEQMAQVEFIRAMEVKINGAEGPMRLMAIGYALFNRWQGAVMTNNPLLIDHFENEMRNLITIADSFS